MTRKREFSLHYTPGPCGSFLWVCVGNAEHERKGADRSIVCVLENRAFRCFYRSLKISDSKIWPILKPKISDVWFGWFGELAVKSLLPSQVLLEQEKCLISFWYFSGLFPLDSYPWPELTLHLDIGQEAHKGCSATPWDRKEMH